MNVLFSQKGEKNSVVIDDEVEHASELVERTKRAIVELSPELAESPMFAAWICDGVLNSMADELGDILLGECPD